MSAPPVVVPSNTNSIKINQNQRSNPVVQAIRNVNKEFEDITVDYQVGKTTGVLFLSLKYHRLHPEYIYQRIEKLGNMYTLRILLLMCDVDEHQDPIRELTKHCLINNITVMIAWTVEEAGYYLSTFKSYEHRPPDMIKERVEKDFPSMYRASLTSISKVNKTDVETLKTNIGSLASIATAKAENMQLLPGLGRVKVRRIKEAFEKPFRPSSTNTKSTAQPTPEVDRMPGRPPSPTWDIELDLLPDEP